MSRMERLRDNRGMTMSEICLTAASDAPAGYAAGMLAPGHVEEFEDHLIGCAECQAAVREALTLSAALDDRGARLRLRVGLGAAAVIVLALGTALAWPADPVRRLGAVGSVPEFRGLDVRSDPDSVSALGDRGMAAYVAGDFEQAAALLGRAAADAAEPGVHFFLGISQLQQRRAEQAAASLERALLPRRNPYEEEALFYLAKARLALGETGAALAALAAVDPDGPQGTRASALADSVRSVLR